MRNRIIRIALLIAAVSLTALYLVDMKNPKPLAPEKDRMDPTAANHDPEKDARLSTGGQSGARNDTAIQPHPDAASSDQAQAHRPPTTPPAELPAERMFISGENMDMNSIRQVITNDGFNDALQSLEAQMHADPLASDLGNLYQDQIDQFLSDGTVQLDRFACGLKICMGSFATTIEGVDLEAAAALISNSPEAPTRFFVGHLQDDESGHDEYRFFLTTDPDVVGATTRPGW